MERKTKIDAEDGRQDLTITREFDLPVELLFKAYAEPDLVAQWMGTKVLKLESRQHGYLCDVPGPDHRVANPSLVVSHGAAAMQTSCPQISCVGCDSQGAALAHARPPLAAG